MGLMGNLLGVFFGAGRNVVAETAGVFRENTEAGAQRSAEYSQAALGQFTAEFQGERKGFFDRFMDGLNRLPRPIMVTATFGFFASAMFDPIWFAARMQGLILVPEPLWWLSGTIVAFYFGGRFQVQSQEFHKSVKQSATLLPEVLENIEEIRALRSDSAGVADTGTDAQLAESVTLPNDSSGNAAISAWKAGAHA